MEEVVSVTNVPAGVENTKTAENKENVQHHEGWLAIQITLPTK